MNTADRNHITIHNMREASDLGASDLVAHSRTINGSTQKIKLMTGANLGFEIMVFIFAPFVINRMCSLKIPMPVSAKVHIIKPNHALSAWRSL